MAKAPAFQFYTGDWMKDPSLSMCTPATRGIWVDFLCAMWENDRSGEITGTVPGLARICRCSPEELADALDELSDTKTADVTKCHTKVTVTNRRMVAENKERENSRLRQKKSRSQKCHGESHKNVTSPSSSSSSSSNLKPVFPDELNAGAWLEYLDHRIAKKVGPLKPKSVEKLIGWLVGQGDYKCQQEIIDKTVRNGWTGLFELDSSEANNGKSSSTGTTSAEKFHDGLKDYAEH